MSESNPSHSPLDNLDSTSSSLLERVQAGESAAWHRLARVYTPLVYGWCRRFNLSAEDAADVIQEVFRSVFGGLASFRHDSPGNSFRGWLWTITRSRICDHFRGQQDHLPAPGGTTAYRQLQNIPDAPPGENDAGASSPFGDVARRAIELMRQDFEESTWRAFWGTAVDGQSPADVARDLGLTVAAVYQAKSRVLRRLRAELAGLTGD
jgi:RNA polymerase sigma-70 factor (ECF subfamily)